MVFEETLSPVRVDPNQLELALLNLALNARDAMAQGGRLTLAARRERVEVAGAQGLDPGDYVCVVVTDSGCGMDEATLKRAAEPFFTTKGVGKGTGLGLSTVYGLAAQSGGVARLLSRVGVGTTVELWLPVAGSAAWRPARPGAAAATGPATPCRVLLVDDDAEVTTATAAMLEQLGHRVVVASSAASALELLGAEAEFDLVITDHAMPGMTGAELAGRIHEARPALPIILATGFADAPGGDGAGMPRLDKPYRIDKLSSAIARAVAPREREATARDKSFAASAPERQVATR